MRLDLHAAQARAHQRRHLRAGQVRLHVPVHRRDHQRKPPRVQRIAHLRAQRPHELLLPPDPPDIAQVVVPEAQEAHHLLAVQALPPGLQVDVEVPGFVVVLHGLPHVHRHAARRVRQGGHGIQAEQRVPVHRQARQVLHGAHQALGAAAAVGAVDLAPPGLRDVHPRVARDAQQVHPPVGPRLRQHDRVRPAPVRFRLGRVRPHWRALVVLHVHARQHQIHRPVGLARQRAVPREKRRGGRHDRHHARQDDQTNHNRSAHARSIPPGKPHADQP